jgi:hypothetical protein
MLNNKGLLNLIGGNAAIYIDSVHGHIKLITDKTFSLRNSLIYLKLRI